MIKIKLKGSLDYLNNGTNGRYIPENVLRTEIEKFNKEIQDKGGILGELNHPDDGSISLGNVSHRINSVEMDEQGLGYSVDMDVLDTPNGKDFQRFLEYVNLEETFKAGFRGYIKEEENIFGEKEVKIEPITFDIIQK